MEMKHLTDSFGRTIGDLRISITDRCNFRCTYCLPEENVTWRNREEILSFEEIVRLVSLFQRLGIRKVRVTGGEPLLRRDVITLIEKLAALGLDDLALTTNGKLLSRFAEPLRRAGLHRLNVSLDTLHPSRFLVMTRRDALGEVLDGIESARKAGFDSIKINAVVIRGVNDDEIVDFARFAAQSGNTVRFIEFMPLDSGHRWSRDQVVPGREIIERIGEAMQIEPLPPRHAGETATRFRITGSSAEIGIIAPVSNPFCGNCNRLRVTGDGQLRTCLFSMVEHDLKTPMRNGFSDEELASRIAVAVLGKEAGHKIGKDEFRQPERTMSCIGG